MESEGGGILASHLGAVNDNTNIWTVLHEFVRHRVLDLLFSHPDWKGAKEQVKVVLLQAHGIEKTHQSVSACCTGRDGSKCLSLFLSFRPINHYGGRWFNSLPEETKKTSLEVNLV